MTSPRIDRINYSLGMSIFLDNVDAAEFLEMLMKCFLGAVYRGCMLQLQYLAPIKMFYAEFVSLELLLHQLYTGTVL